MAREVTMDDILMVVANHFQIGRDLIRGTDKSNALVFPRQVAIYLMTRMTGHGYKDIQAFMGGRKFSAIQNSIKAVRSPRAGNDLETDRTVIKLAGDIRVRAELADDTPKTPLQRLEDVIERSVSLYTDLQAAEKQREDTDERDDDQPGGHSEEDGVPQEGLVN